MTKEQEQSDVRRRVRVRYEGMVQGVGFRYTTIRIASRFDVAGYVRNCADGSVELVAEGPEPELLNFLRAIRLSPLGRYIVSEHMDWGPATGEFLGFNVRY